jgi:V8-like Glu-specific endopeptidase
MKHIKIRLFSRLFAVSVFVGSVSALAAPLGAVPYLELERSLPVSMSAGVDFNGIVALNNCSGSIVRFQTSLDEENAMVLTNGHCLANSTGGGMPSPGVVIVNQAANRDIFVLNPSNGSKIGSIHATKILYATMTKTDMTLYMVRETYREIAEKFSVRPLTIANRYPSIGEGIDVISGYWRRGYTCRVEAIIPELREAGWSMSDSIRYSRPGCNTIGGTSGSPVISLDTKEVVGVNNTGNESGKKCTMNNPCEVDSNGSITYEKGRSYGQQVSWVYGCLTSDRKIDLNIAGCQLAKPAPARPSTSSESKKSIWPSSLGLRSSRL